MRIMTISRRLTRTQKARFARHLDFALDLVGPYRRLFPRFGDELQDAAIDALLGLVRRYERGRKVPFEAYARRRIRYALGDRIRQLMQRPERHNEIAVLLLVAREQPVGAELEESELIERWLEAYPEEDRAMIRRRVLGGLSFERLANELGMSKTTLRKRLERLLGPGPDRPPGTPCACSKRGPS
jgi:RNA polymerase sigma factor (sigma-70 family)